LPVRPFWTLSLFSLLVAQLGVSQTTPAPSSTVTASSSGISQSSLATTCSPGPLEIDGNQIWVDQQGTGDVTVVFEPGFGNDSSVWSEIASKIRAAGVRTFVYDRAGMGKSTIDTSTPYSLSNDVHILRTALERCGIHAPVVLVGHSYGGAISLMAASEDTDIRGMVLVDAVVPNVWLPSVVERNLAAMRAQYAEIREQAPAMAKVAIPFAEAMLETAKTINTLRMADSLPVIDIVAEKGMNDPDSARIWRAAHQQFTAGAAHRELVMAMGSSHKVMLDQPELVMNSILKMIETVKATDKPH